MFKKLYLNNYAKLWSIALLMSSIGLIIFTYFELEKNNNSFYHNYILSTEVLVDTAKKINQYANATETEIKYFKNTNFEIINKDLLSQIEKINTFDFKKYKVKELEDEINSIISINTLIVGHLKDSENQLANKLYKTEFLSHRDKFIQLIDSTKKEFLIKMKQKHKINSNSLSLSISFVFLLFVSIFSFITMIRFQNGNKKLHHQIEAYQSELNENKSLISNLNGKIENKVLIETQLKEELKFIKESLIEKNEKLQKIVISYSGSKEYVASDKSVDNLNEKIKYFINQFQKFYQSYQFFSLDINNFNKNLLHIKNAGKQLNVQVMNEELSGSSSKDTLLIKELLNSIENLNTINYMNMDNDVLSSVQDAREHLSQIYILEENLNKVIVENNENFHQLLREVQNKLIESKNLINSLFNDGFREFNEKFD